MSKDYSLSDFIIDVEYYIEEFSGKLSDISRDRIEELYYEDYTASEAAREIIGL